MSKPNYARTCLHCDHLIWQQGYQGWSEYTPGSPPSLYCSKGHFYDSLSEGCDTNLVDLLKQGNECVDFEDKR